MYCFVFPSRSVFALYELKRKKLGPYKENHECGGRAVLGGLLRVHLEEMNENSGHDEGKGLDTAACSVKKSRQHGTFRGEKIPGRLTPEERDSAADAVQSEDADQAAGAIL